MQGGEGLRKLTCTNCCLCICCSACSSNCSNLLLLLRCINKHSAPTPAVAAANTAAGRRSLHQLPAAGPQQPDSNQQQQQQQQQHKPYQEKEECIPPFRCSSSNSHAGRKGSAYTAARV